MLDKNKSKWFDLVKYHMKNNNDTNEMGAVSCSSSGYDGLEMLLSVLSFPKTLKLLEDPNIWIADTVATCDSMPHNISAVMFVKEIRLLVELSLVKERIMKPT
jgi:hypothetical protein